MFGAQEEIEITPSKEHTCKFTRIPQEVKWKKNEGYWTINEGTAKGTIIGGKPGIVKQPEVCKLSIVKCIEIKQIQ